MQQVRSKSAGPIGSLLIALCITACGKSGLEGNPAALSASPLDFGGVVVGQTSSLTLTIANVSDAAADLSSVAVTGANPADFQLLPGLPSEIAPGTSASATVTFSPSAPGPRHASVQLAVDAAATPTMNVDLSGVGLVTPCTLSISPATLDFGNVAPGSVTTYRVALTNIGDQACALANITFENGTDPGFTLPSAQPTAITVQPGGAGFLSVTFTAPQQNTPPPVHQGGLSFQSGDDPSPVTSTVPLVAYVNAKCAAPASQTIYTIDANRMLSVFDPSTLTFQDLGVVSCPTVQPDDTPFSMSVDQNGAAWIEFDTGKLFQVDLATRACQATGFVAGQQGFDLFGMSFVFETATGLDTLFIGGVSWGDTGAQLGTLAFPSLTVSALGALSLGLGDFAGTGDGELWGMFPHAGDGGIGTLARIDPTSGEALESFGFSIPTSVDVDLFGDGGTIVAGSEAGWAIKFWGGSLWVFWGDLVYQVSRTTGAQTLVVTSAGRNIVGAGVSTCAPVQ